MGPLDWNKLTAGQKDLLRGLVRSIRNDEMPEEFTVMWGVEGTFVFWPGLNAFRKTQGITAARLDALQDAQLLRCNPKVETTQNQFGSSQREMARDIALTALAYKAVDTDFDAPDVTYVQLLTPLANLYTMDPELVSRCFPILGAGPGDPKMWDSAVRTAGVILEDRLRRLGGIEDGSIGQEQSSECVLRNEARGLPSLCLVISQSS
ncbi:MAG: hypothetical protein DME44_00380 [Verrucomicrobia bacterium]|nr:MAG: hypothetical protein DME44_00380 [Verrucomicrobiota bacterium]